MRLHHRIWPLSAAIAFALGIGIPATPSAQASNVDEITGLQQLQAKDINLANIKGAPPGIGDIHSVVASFGDNGYVGVDKDTIAHVTGGLLGTSTDPSAVAFDSNANGQIIQARTVADTYSTVGSIDINPAAMIPHEGDIKPDDGDITSEKTAAIDPSSKMGIDGDQTYYPQTALDSPPIGVPQPATYEGAPPLMQQGLKTAAIDTPTEGIDGDTLKMDLTASATSVGDPGKNTIVLTEPPRTGSFGQVLGAEVSQLS